MMKLLFFVIIICPNILGVENSENESQQSKSFAGDKREPDESTKNGWKEFAVCLAKNNIFKQLMDDINGKLGTWGDTCSIPVVRELWDTVRCGGYVVALENWATEENMSKTLTTFQSTWKNEPCTKALVASNDEVVREQRRRRRLKKYEASDSAPAKETWGLNMNVGINILKYQMFWSMGFVVNNCGCESWEDELDQYKRKPDLGPNEMTDERVKHRDVEFYCVNDAGKCWLPSIDGQCKQPNTHICKNTGVTWVWGKSSTIGLGTDLIKTLGLSALGGGISIGLTYDYAIPDMTCRFFPGISLGASTVISFGDGDVGASLGGSLSLSVRVACPTNADCGPTEVRYCGTSLGVSFSTNANIAALAILLEDVIESGVTETIKLLKGPKLDLDLQINLPLPSFLSILTGGGPIKGPSPIGCDIVAYSVGPAVYGGIPSRSNYPFSDHENGKWMCDASSTTIPESLLNAHPPTRPFDAFNRVGDHNYWYADVQELKVAKPETTNSWFLTGILVFSAFLSLTLVSTTKLWKKTPQTQPLLTPVPV